MRLHQRWQRVSFITSQEINVTNLRDVKSAGKFCNSSHIKLESCFSFTWQMSSRFMQDRGKGCVTLGFYPPLPSCFAQRRSDAAFWTCLESAGFFSVQAIDGNRQKKETDKRKMILPKIPISYNIRVDRNDAGAPPDTPCEFWQRNWATVSALAAWNRQKFLELAGQDRIN